jgi:hypothetical protein
MTEYVSVKLPAAFVELVERETKDMCWNSRADMVKFALREMMHRQRSAKLRIPYEQSAPGQLDD